MPGAVPRASGGSAVTGASVQAVLGGVVNGTAGGCAREPAPAAGLLSCRHRKASRQRVVDWLCCRGKKRQKVGSPTADIAAYDPGPVGVTPATIAPKASSRSAQPLGVLPSASGCAGAAPAAIDSRDPHNQDADIIRSRRAREFRSKNHLAVRLFDDPS